MEYWLDSISALATFPFIHKQDIFSLVLTLEKERNKLEWHLRGAAVASASNSDGWHNLLADLKSPHGPDEDK